MAAMTLTMTSAAPPKRLTSANIRHVGLWLGAWYRHIQSTSTTLHRPLLWSLSGCRRIHGAHPQRSHRMRRRANPLWRRVPLSTVGGGAAKRAMERAAINAPMQGSAADLIKIAMLAIHRWIRQNKMKTNMILQVHDELVLESPRRKRKKYAPNCLSSCAPQRSACRWKSISKAPPTGMRHIKEGLV